ncbi:MAG: molybdate ABC transporter substrate-binding protein [Albidovulum sp.]
MIRLFALFFLVAWPLRAETALIAVATNFRPAAEALAEAYSSETGHDIRLSAGATGKLAAQISAGAPYDAFLSADAETAVWLEAAGLAVPDSRFTYAVGHLILWSRNPDADFTNLSAYFAGIRHLAVANPNLAPYGKSAMEVLENMSLIEAIEGKIVQGENIGQVFAMVYGGAAEAGFIAASAQFPTALPGAAWTVPDALHSPIRQDAVLVLRGQSNDAATGFLDFLRSTQGRHLIEAFGYGTAP